MTDRDVDSAPKCPKCVRLQRTGHDQTVGRCPRCGRWQYLYQAAFHGFGDAIYQHLGCVACGDGAWCRDFVERPDAGGCAYRTHVHGLDERCELGV